MTSFSAAKGRKVVSIETAATVGKVADYVIDPVKQQVAAVVLKKTSGDDDVLPWGNIAAFGDDAVTVKTEGAIVALDEHLTELADKKHAASNKRVLSADGVELGVAKDVEFDAASGNVEALILKDGSVEGHRLLAVGSYAVIVNA